MLAFRHTLRLRRFVDTLFDHARFSPLLASPPKRGYEKSF